jgi:hypothetical protein
MKKYYLIKGDIHKIEDHEYSDDNLFWIHGDIIKKAEVPEEDEVPYFRSKRKKQKHTRSYGLMYRRNKKKEKKKTNISWMPKRRGKK